MEKIDILKRHFSRGKTVIWIAIIINPNESSPRKQLVGEDIILFVV
jgi:hypothetical protein